MRQGSATTFITESSNWRPTWATGEGHILVDPRLELVSGNGCLVEWRGTTVWTNHGEVLP